MVLKGREFNDILDECLERILTGEETLQQCLDRYPDYAAELEPLLRTAVATRKLQSIEPDSEFRARARYQLRLEMDRIPSGRWQSILKWRPSLRVQPRWVVTMVVVLALVLAGGTTVLAAESSMPGSPLYPVKLATENVRLTFSSSDVARAELYAALADRRIEEITYAIEKGKTKYIKKVTERLNKHLEMITSLSLASGTEPDTVEDVAMTPPLKDEAADDKPVIETKPQKEPGKEKPELPSTESKRPDAGVKEGPGVSAQARPETDAEINERAKLKALVEDYSVNHPEKLRELLEIAPESVKPAILEAITASEDSYKKVLEELDNRSGGAAAAAEEPGTEKQDDAPKDEGSRSEQPGNSPANGDTAPGQSGNSPAEDGSSADRSGNSLKKK